MTAGSMVPLPTVAATFSWKTKMATMLKKAAIITAVCGFSTRVETTVAMAFAASWKPFMKSNASASRTRQTTTPRPMFSCSMNGFRSGVFEDDAFEDVGHILAAIGDRFEQFVDRLQLDQL